MNTQVTKAIELLEAYGVNQALVVKGGLPVRGITIDSENAYHVRRAANGDMSIELSNDVDIDGVFEEEKIPGVTWYSDKKNDNYGAPYYPVRILQF